MSSILNGIYLFHCISSFRVILGTAFPSDWFRASAVIVSLAFSIGSCCLWTRNEIPAVVITRIHFIHALVGSAGFISPLAFVACVDHYGNRSSAWMRHQRNSIAFGLFLDLLVSILLDFIYSQKVLYIRIIPVTSFLMWSFSNAWIVPTSPVPREVSDKCVNTIGSKFMLRPPLSIKQLRTIYFLPQSQIGSIDKWLYIDLHGTVQGPFTNDQMAAWYKAGFLKDDLRVSPADEYTFRTIREQFQSVPPFE
jgi:hypothetical protein